VVERQSLEASFQLLAIVDLARAIGGGELAVTGQPPIRVPVALAFPVAGVDQEAIAPAIEPIGVAQGRQLAPDLDQRLLHRILGQLSITQDAKGDLLEACVRCLGP